MNIKESKLKSYLRSVEARTRETLHEAIRDGLQLNNLGNNITNKANQQINNYNQQIQKMTEQFNQIL